MATRRPNCRRKEGHNGNQNAREAKDYWLFLGEMLQKIVGERIRKMNREQKKSNAEKQATRPWGMCEGEIAWYTVQPFERWADFVPDGVLTPHCHGINPDNGVPTEQILLCAKHAMQFEEVCANVGSLVTMQLQQRFPEIVLEGRRNGGCVAMRFEARRRGLTDSADDYCWVIDSHDIDAGEVYLDTNGCVAFHACGGYLRVGTLRVIADFMTALEATAQDKPNACQNERTCQRKPMSRTDIN